MDGSRAQQCSCDHSTVLVVEDELDIREAVRDVLEEEGYRVLPASNGREALTRLSETPAPCVVLLDLMMPVMNGWQLLEALRSRTDLSQIPVVLVSAADRLPEGACAVIRKPFNLDNLLEAVERYCHGRAANA